MKSLKSKSKSYEHFDDSKDDHDSGFVGMTSLGGTPPELKHEWSAHSNSIVESGVLSDRGFNGIQNAQTQEDAIDKSHSDEYSTKDIFVTWHRNVASFPPALPGGGGVIGDHEVNNENTTDERVSESKADSPNEEIYFSWRRNNKGESAADRGMPVKAQCDIKLNVSDDKHFQFGAEKQRQLTSSRRSRSPKPKHLKVYQVSVVKSDRRRGRERSPKRLKERRKNSTNQQKHQEEDYMWSRVPRNFEDKKITSSGRVDGRAIGEIARRLENSKKYEEDKKKVTSKVRGRRYRSTIVGQKNTSAHISRKPRSMSPNSHCITRAAIENSSGKQIRKSMKSIRSFQANQNTGKSEESLSRDRQTSRRNPSLTSGQRQRRSRMASSNEHGEDVIPSRRSERRSRRDRRPTKSTSIDSSGAHSSLSARGLRSGRTRGRYSSRSRSPSVSSQNQSESKDELHEAAAAESFHQESPTRSKSLPEAGQIVAIPTAKTASYRGESGQQNLVSLGGLSNSGNPDSSNGRDGLSGERLSSQQCQLESTSKVLAPQFRETPEKEQIFSWKRQLSAKPAADQLNKNSGSAEVQFLWHRNNHAKSARPARPSSTIVWHRKSTSKQSVKPNSLSKDQR